MKVMKDRRVIRIWGHTFVVSNRALKKFQVSKIFVGKQHLFYTHGRNRVGVTVSGGVVHRKDKKANSLVGARFRSVCMHADYLDYYEKNAVVQIRKAINNSDLLGLICIIKAGLIERCRWIGKE